MVAQQIMFPIVFYSTADAAVAAASAISSQSCSGMEYSSFKVCEVPTKHFGLNRCAHVGCLPVAALQGHRHLREHTGLGTQLKRFPHSLVGFL